MVKAFPDESPGCESGGSQYHGFDMLRCHRLDRAQEGPLVWIHLVNERTGEPFYLVHVAVPDDELMRLGDRRLQPGIPVDVMIKTGERTALQYLFQPLVDSLDHAWREE